MLVASDQCRLIRDDVDVYYSLNPGNGGRKFLTFFLVCFMAEVLERGKLLRADGGLVAF